MQANNAGQGQMPDDGQQMAHVSAKEFGAKFQSKREIYVFLANECEVYLPPYGTCCFLSILMQRIMQTTRLFTS